MTGLQIKDEQSIVAMGPKQDVKFYRYILQDKRNLAAQSVCTYSAQFFVVIYFYFLPRLLLNQFVQ